MKGIKKTELGESIDHVSSVVDLQDDLDKRVSGYSGG